MTARRLTPMGEQIAATADGLELPTTAFTGTAGPRLTMGVAASARYCGMSVKTFNNARRSGSGPDAFTAHGGRVRFAKAALDRWMTERRDIDPMSPRGAA